MKHTHLLAGALSMMLTVCGTTFFPSLTASATYGTVLLGDSSGTDGVTSKDAQWIQQYLRGQVTATQWQLTAMDINEDGVIDQTDARTIQYKLTNGGSFTSKYKELYSVPDNSDVSYYKYNCSTHSIQSYNISATTAKPYPTYNLSNDDELENIRSDDPDYQNIECVKVTGSVGQGSGFVVDDHLVLTAAHCVYDNNSFSSNVAITIYDENMGHYTPISASYIHVPENYVLNGNVNYDYALIYVEEDLSDLVVNIGVMTDYFMTTGQNLTTSGFTTYNNVFQRYYSSGSVTTMSSYPLEAPYRFHSNGICKSGKSGGMVYFNSTSSPTSSYTINTKSVVGNATHTTIPYVNDTYGCRMTTSVLRFIYQNNNF